MLNYSGILSSAMFVITFIGFYSQPSQEALGIFAFSCLVLIATQLIQRAYKQKDAYMNEDAILQLKQEIKEIKENETLLKLRLDDSHNKVESIKAALQIRTLGH